MSVATISPTEGLWTVFRPFGTGWCHGPARPVCGPVRLRLVVLLAERAAAGVADDVRAVTGRCGARLCVLAGRGRRCSPQR